MLLFHLAGPGSFVAPADILDTIARLHPLDAAGLNVLIALNVFVALNRFVGRDRPGGLNCLVVLDVRVGGLDPLNVFVALNSLDSFDSLHTLDTLCAFADLHGAGLRSTQGLDALQVSRADIAELLLEICVPERRVAMHRVEPPGLPGDGSDGAPVKSAVEDGVGLDRRETGMSPVVAVP